MRLTTHISMHTHTPTPKLRLSYTCHLVIWLGDDESSASVPATSLFLHYMWISQSILLLSMFPMCKAYKQRNKNSLDKSQGCFRVYIVGEQPLSICRQLLPWSPFWYMPLTRLPAKLVIPVGKTRLPAGALTHWGGEARLWLKLVSIYMLFFFLHPLMV